MTPLLTTDGGVTLIGGGAVAVGDLEAALGVAPRLVAADSGADTALASGYMPDLVIGDFDSVSPAARAAIPAGRLHPVAEQDSTDFEKCLQRLDARFVIAVGFTGLRLDHTLAALSVMTRWPDLPILMLAAEEVVFLCPPRLTLPLTPGERVSLWPMGPASGRSSGLRWPIDGIGFAPAGRVGTSNEALGPVTIEADGPMLVLLPRSCFGVAVDAVLRV